MTEELFHEVIGAQVIVVQKGVFKQVPLFYRRERLFAGLASGYARIGAQGATSAPGVSWEALDLPELSGVLVSIPNAGHPIYVPAASPLAAQALQESSYGA